MVLDTNIVVSALLTPGGTSDRVLRAALAGMLVPLFDQRILMEYEEVLRRENFSFRPADVRVVLDALEQEGEEVVALPVPVELPDPDDLPFLEVAIAGGALALVTGNAAHFRPAKGTHTMRLASPSDVLSLLAKQG